MNSLDPTIQYISVFWGFKENKDLQLSLVEIKVLQLFFLQREKKIFHTIFKISFDKAIISIANYFTVGYKVLYKARRIKNSSNLPLLFLPSHYRIRTIIWKY